MDKKKKPAGNTPVTNFRLKPDDLVYIATIAGRLKVMDGDGSTTRAIRNAVRFTANAGIPLIGEVGGGKERWHEYDKAETIPVSTLAPDDVVAYRVRGNSMIEKHIIDGDYVLIKPQETADHGATVVAWIRGAGGLVKSFDAEKKELYSGKGKDRWSHPMGAGDRLFGIYVGVIREG